MGDACCHCRPDDAFLIHIERGYDPKQFAAMPFGGGGALHAGALIKDIGLSAALVPRFPGVNSALGCVMSDLRHDEVRTINSQIKDLDIAALGFSYSMRSILWSHTQLQHLDNKCQSTNSMRKKWPLGPQGRKS